MTSNNRISWSEGMFLRPQHFQQQDRFLLEQLHNIAQGMHAYYWGFTALTLDRELLKVGKLSFKKCRGVLPDGLYFDLEGNMPVLDLPEGSRDLTIYLSLPVTTQSGQEFSNENDADHVRFHSYVQMIRDAADASGQDAEIEVAKPRFNLSLSNQQQDAFQTLAVAKVLEVGADRNIHLDEDFIPPALDANNQTNLHGFIVELESMLHQRAENLATRVSGAGRSSTEIADFLLLQAINRIEPLIHHLLHQPCLHPLQLYQQLLQTAGELATFTNRNRRPENYPPYRQDALKDTFLPIMTSLRLAMSTVLEAAATQIELSQPNQYGIRTGAIGNQDMLRKAMFIFAIQADVPDDRLRQGLPGQMKVGSVEKIAQLINKSLPGVNISPLPAAPRQIPYQAGTTYFQLDKTSSAWQDIESTGNLALHVAGQYPGLDISFWAIRQ
ncbi:type VI secretion system baseplate subunit TssK [Bowmanella yangjiangensis]|uniref:Type VI secretion system baseplate subunit TssK n=1 Tax=Bowmanella yangjiangensis TaxID=2811230 RepID=A0ABS3CX05_9ALTE|nr:type VI secretion system baseplate subunit TssK [Bowmanella yangjiangensis]MBN7821662.1 type VI secretion system baseplate subunit TssK [Bowmanella yangjiangensis]